MNFLFWTSELFFTISVVIITEEGCTFNCGILGTALFFFAIWYAAILSFFHLAKMRGMGILSYSYIRNLWVFKSIPTIHWRTMEKCGQGEIFLLPLLICVPSKRIRVPSYRLFSLFKCLVIGSDFWSHFTLADFFFADSRKKGITLEKWRGRDREVRGGGSWVGESLWRALRSCWKWSVASPTKTKPAIGSTFLSPSNKHLVLITFNLSGCLESWIKLSVKKSCCMLCEPLISSLCTELKRGRAQIVTLWQKTLLVSRGSLLVELPSGHPVAWKKDDKWVKIPVPDQHFNVSRRTGMILQTPPILVVTCRVAALLKRAQFWTPRTICFAQKFLI